MNLQTAFNQGLAAGLDPDREATIAHGGQTTTTLRSSWLHARCPVCAHTFRLGDAVMVDTDGTVRHDTGSLRCSGRQAEAPRPAFDPGAFFAGLHMTWPPPKDLPLVRLEAGHALLAPPVRGFKRKTCFVCGHTFREHDQVVICPCSPHAPRCEMAVHRDLVAGLHCMDNWNPKANQEGYRQTFCPVTSAKLDG